MRAGGGGGDGGRGGYDARYIALCLCGLRSLLREGEREKVAEKACWRRREGTGVRAAMVSIDAESLGLSEG